MKNDAINKLSADFTIDKTFAIGNDVVFMPNFEASFTPAFKTKVYTQAELTYCQQFSQPLLRYASTWAAKEAVYKAVKQLGAAVAGWQNIEIIRNKIAGQPNVVLHQYPNKFAISLSISHDGAYVWAVALAQLKYVKT
ncbi:MAG: 4'-phosphopantetheinyl transferase superfamily protein [Sphingobacteriales bacterium]|nr:MAG: 4'-phosphopantetheinyl transferase superfamily protein [Sphingobacteriales bacterium]TAF81244.1 MAG: 4'-phosphopantetheinyl transferase superfamily protein [Sphingobacteriales bacterium]